MAISRLKPHWAKKQFPQTCHTVWYMLPLTLLSYKQIANVTSESQLRSYISLLRNGKATGLDFRPPEIFLEIIDW